LTVRESLIDDDGRVTGIRPSTAAELLAWDRPVAIAHRGGSRLRPENTMPAFEHAWAIGADAVECDVHLSRDGEPVIIHDATLDRTTDASGPVASRTADELASVDAGCRFTSLDGAAFRGKPGVPRLAELLARSPVPVIVEIKGDAPETAIRTLEVIAAAGAASRTIVGGFSQTVLDAVRTRVPGMPTSASSREAQSALRRSYCWLRPRRPGYAVFQVPLRLRGRRVLTRTFVRLARRANIPVQVWVVDDIDEMNFLLDWGAAGLISDRPDLAVAMVRSRSGR
jgi:glycerophosphoryl diester phosphodiesterase